MKIDTNLTKASYMMKRLRDSGYKADKLIGVSDSSSLAVDLGNLTERVFLRGRNYSPDEILTIISERKTEFIRCMYQPPQYSERDCRVWTILIDGGRDGVFLTFYKNAKNNIDRYEDYGKDYFELTDGGQFILPTKKRIHTHSFEVVAQELNDMGIFKKYSQ